MYRLAVGFLWALGFQPASAQVWWYDRSVASGYQYDNAYPDADGGRADFGQDFGLQVGQLFDARETIADTFEADFIQVSDENTQAWVEVYDATGSELLFSSGLVTCRKSYFTDNVFGLTGVSYRANPVFSGFVPGRRYLAVMQVVGPSFGWIATSENGVQEAFGRDASHFGYGGGYGTTEWTPLGQLAGKDGQAFMRIGNITPEPTALLAAGAALMAVARKRGRP